MEAQGSSVSHFFPIKYQRSLRQSVIDKIVTLEFSKGFKMCNNEELQKDDPCKSLSFFHMSNCSAGF